ncbi:MAG: adenosylcobinamide-GDP ribazoletransferase [Marmoricola sp.]
MRDGWRLAAGTLTALRVRPPEQVDAPTFRTAMLLAPLAVAPLGVGVALVGVIGGPWGLPPLLLAVLAVGVSALGTRALHLDGLSDTVDGLTASYDRERSLAVMRSGTAGPAGVVALVLVLGVQVSALASLVGPAGTDASAGPVARAVVAGVALCVSRCALAVCCARPVPAARADGLGAGPAGTVPVAAAALSWLLAAAALAAACTTASVPWWRGVVAAALGLGVTLLVVRRATRRLGGITGDVLGAAVELAWAAVLLGLVVRP